MRTSRITRSRGHSMPRSTLVLAIALFTADQGKLAAGVADNVLVVPVSALFRKGEDWAVFAVKDGRARTTTVKIGHRNGRQAEVLTGLSAGDRVVMHPSDRVKEGVQVRQRGTE